MADVTGTTGNDTLTGTSGNDNIFGLEGNDTLDGAGGIDNLTGGSGDDTYFVDADDSVFEDIGGGYDYVIARSSYVLAAGVSVELMSTDNNAGTAARNLTGNELANIIVGNAGANVLNGGLGGADLLVGLGGDDTYFVDADDRVLEDAGAGYDYVIARTSYVLAAGVSVELLSTDDNGGTAARNLSGNEVANIIVGNAGSNVIDGGNGGADVLVGLGGDDTYFVDGNDQVAETAGGGYDYVIARSSYVLAAGVSAELMSTDNNAGTTAINLTGNELANIIVGNAGSNVIDGGTGGGDLMVGLGGNDTYFVDGNDQVNEDAGGGSDYVIARTSYVLAAGVSAELLSTDNNAGTAAINLTGNELANVIVGNAGNNAIDGGAGGGDVLVGLGGNDTYFVDGNDQVNEDAGGGSDYVIARTSYVLAAGVSAELLSTDNNAGTAAINLTGNELANIIVGNAGNNAIDGGAGGGDVLVGLGGNDTYFVDGNDQVTEDAGGGSDYVVARTSYVLAAGASVELMSTDDNGSTAARNLTGNELANTLFGNAGSNVLDGKGGADTFFGFGGADTFAFTVALGGGNIDAISDFATGIDKIQLGAAAGEPFAALASGTLSAAAFVIGTQALQADDYIIYNSTTGALLYDSDGNGAAAAVQFATLSTGLALSAGDFIVSGPANSAPAVTSGTTATVVENTAASTVIYTATATDANGDRITWSLGGADAGLLTIDANSGQVRLLSPADYETRASYTFSVIASDSGPTAGTQQVVLSVTDVVDSGTPIVNEQEPNDSSSQTQGIDRNLFAVVDNPNLENDDLPSVTVVGNLPTSADEDWFRVELQAGELIILDVDNSSGNLDAFVQLFRAGQTEAIATNDDRGALDPGSGPHPEYGHNTDSYIRFRVPTTGTYYIKMTSFQDAENPTFGSYQLHISIGPPATAAELINEDIEALISGSEWPSTLVTYAFPNAAGDYPPNPGDTEFGDNEPATFEAFTGAQQTAVQALLQLISRVSALTFQQLFDPQDATAQLRFAMTDETEAAHAYYPGNANEAGSAWFNKDDFDAPQIGNYAWMGILHEIGHALGLKHGHEPPAIQPDRDSLEYSVMTYRSFPGQEVDGGGGYTNETWGFPQTLMMYDIAALQRIYGANFATNNGNSVYTFSTSTGEMLINGAGQGAAGNGTPSSNRIFRTIWDGGGTDTYDLNNYSTAMTIDLRPGEWSTFSTADTAQRANLGSGHFARGHVANALLFEGNTASLIENAIGGSNSDILIANQAANQLRGNGGADTFRWMAAGDAGTGALSDTVLDFAVGVDKVDLSNIDAISGTGTNDAFSFIGGGAFTNVAGQLRYAGGHIYGDLDGNGSADFDIIMTNAPALGVSDFML